MTYPLISKTKSSWILERIQVVSIVCPCALSVYYNQFKGYSKTSRQTDYLKCCKILGISVDSDQEQVRQAFLKLVKRFHPDSGSSEANEEKFREVEAAYRTVQDKFTSERWSVNKGAGEYGLYYQEKKEVTEFDIKHTAPQHRQYLSYDGYGSGTPQQRQKQYQKLRAMTAIQNVYNHRVSKLSQGEECTLVAKDKREAKKITIRSEMDRMVEDMIQESMARGDFDNLPGSGKPLPQQNINPYVDFVTQKLNQMLIDNGFTPTWITLQKEIIHEIQTIRLALSDKRAYLGKAPLAVDEAKEWASTLTEYQKHMLELNKKINTFNLLVPILKKQMVLFRLEYEANKILLNGKTKFDDDYVRKAKRAQTHNQEKVAPSIFQIFEWFSEGKK